MELRILEWAGPGKTGQGRRDRGLDKSGQGRRDRGQGSCYDLFHVLVFFLLLANNPPSEVVAVLSCLALP